MCYVSTQFATFTSQWILGIIATGEDMIMNYYQEPAVSCVAISRKISKTANNAYFLQSLSMGNAQINKAFGIPKGLHMIQFSFD